MISRKTSIFCAGIALFATACLTSCGGSDQDNAPAAAPVSPVIDATNWNSVELDGRINRFDGKTVIDTTGHFDAAHNNCSKEDVGGAYSLDFWNTLATQMNDAMKAPLTGPEQCIDNPYNDTMIDGNVIVTTDTGKVTLYEAKNDQTCTHIQDPALAQSLFQTLNQALSHAGAEDCAHPI